MVPSARFAMENGLQRVRADVAAAGGHGDRPGGEFDQGGVEPGAAEGVGDRELPDRARTRTPAEVLEQLTGVPDGGPAVGRRGEGDAARRRR